jgi:hypothetical protein
MRKMAYRWCWSRDENCVEENGARAVKKGNEDDLILLAVDALIFTTECAEVTEKNKFGSGVGVFPQT